jgi:hypothetical protein
MTRTREGTIYALIDPRDDKIRYIGKTEKPILARLASHLATPTNPAMRVWINALSLQGLTPRIEAVTTVPVSQLDEEEQRQIQRHADAGHRLFNAPYYHDTVTDLGQKQTDPGQKHDAPQPPRTAILDERLAHWAFSRLAKARATDRIPAWAAAAAVILGAPAYTAALLSRAVLHVLLNTAPGNFAAAAVMGGWLLWDAGFDAAVREVLLPRLPVTQWSAFWSEYMASPLAELASDFLWPVLGTSVVLAGASYVRVAEGTDTRQDH